MIRPELVQAIADKTRLPKNKIDLVLDSMIETIIEEVADNKKVLLSGFGLFYSAHRKARNGINPNTKEPMKIGGMQLPKFRPGTKFKKALEQEK